MAFKPLDAGSDLSIEAATKFFGGHSDVLLGSISTNDFGYFETLRETQSITGQQASPEDCFRVLRGLKTLGIRYAAQSKSTLEIAQWLQGRPSVRKVLFPALKSDAGYDLWKRDFKNNGCLFSLILMPAPDQAYSAFFKSVRLFAIGASWGGVHSLAAFYPASMQRTRLFSLTDQPIIRLSIGLEPQDELIREFGNEGARARCNLEQYWQRRRKFGF